MQYNCFLPFRYNIVFQQFSIHAPHQTLQYRHPKLPASSSFPLLSQSLHRNCSVGWPVSIFHYQYCLTKPEFLYFPRLCFIDLLLQMSLSSVPPLPLGIFFCLASNFVWLFMMLVGVNPSTSNFNRFLVSMCQLLNVHAFAASHFSLYASFAATQHLVSVCTLFLRLYP